MFFSQFELIIRLVISAIMGGVIGYEREMRGRDAGIRTHAIVSIGATIMALIQLSSSQWLLDFAAKNPVYYSVLSSDITRFIAQVVSGIGFLGAGTIIVSRRSVTGLTTAASLWAVAGIGISIGMGYYTLGLSGTILILIVLRGIKIIFRMDRDKNVEIHYKKNENVTDFIEKKFGEHNIKIISEDYSFSYLDGGETLCKIIYELHIPDEIQLKTIVNEIGEHKSISKISTIKWN